MRNYLLSVALLTAAACSNSNAETGLKTLEIAAERVPCHGVAPQQCLIVNGELFYDEIIGFDPVEGNTYVVEVEVRELSPEETPADAPSILYRLKRVISKNGTALAAIEDPELSGTGWRLTKFGRGATMRLVPDSIDVTLEFAGAQISGSGGCNTYVGSYTQNERSLTITVGGATKALCEPRVMEFEDAFLAQLDNAQEFAWTDNKLTIQLSGSSSMVFERYQRID